MCRPQTTVKVKESAVKVKITTVKVKISTVEVNFTTVKVKVADAPIRIRARARSKRNIKKYVPSTRAYARKRAQRLTFSHLVNFP